MTVRVMASWPPGVSSATLTWPVGPGSIVSAFGVNLAPVTAGGLGRFAPYYTRRDSLACTRQQLG